MKTKGKLLCVVCASAVFLGGCASPTQAVVNTVAPPEIQVSKTISQEEEKGLKRKVAVAKFSNETRHGNSFLLDRDGDRVGNQAKDILAARLVESGKFLLLEREDLDEIETEQALTGISSELIGADYLIVGSVSEYGRSTVSEVGIFSRNKKQKVRAVVNVRLLDVRTGQIIFSEEGTGEALSEAGSTFGVGEVASYDSSLDDKALSAAISKLISNLIENLLDNPWVAYIVDVDQDSIIISGGKSQGLKRGDVLRILKRGKRVKNPQTGILIELPGKEVARMKVVDFVGDGNNEVSIGQISFGSIVGESIEHLIVHDLES